jgi:hypothetical protein
MSEEQKLDPSAARVIAQVRRLMLISGLVTLIAIGAILAVIGYRVFRSEGSMADATVVLPKGARVVATSTGDDRLVVTIDVGGATEVRVYDLRTLKPAGRLRFTNEP